LIEVNGWLIEKALRPMFRKFSLLGNKVFFDNEDFPITKVLEDKYPIIKGEFEKMQDRLNDFAPFQEISPDQIYISNDDKWKMFFLKAGKVRFERNCQEFPETMKIIDKDRIVLFLDYMRPLPWPLNWLNHFVVYMARFFPYFRIPVQKHKEWEKKFYGEAA
jgi:aspartyl/asparaginyl beta-hydroxylase (cupin superfamily)